MGEIPWVTAFSTILYGGITTAASLWVIAAVGMAVGLGYYIAAFVTALLVFTVLFVKRFISKGKKNSGYAEKPVQSNSS